MNKRSEKILVTGENGFIGSCLFNALKKEKYNVAGLEKININDFNKVLSFFKKNKFSAVFHLAAVLPGKEKNTQDFFETNAIGTLNLLEACRLFGVRNFIYSSTMMVYGKNIKYLPVDEKHPANPSDFYGQSKLMGEQLVEFYSRQHNLNSVILRYSGVYGPGKKEGAIFNFFENAKKNKPIKILNNIDWDIISVEDIVKANIGALKKAEKLKCETINIGSGKKININDLAEKIRKIANSKSKIEFNKNKPEFNFYFNIKKAEKLLNFKPKNYDTSLQAYLA